MVEFSLILEKATAGWIEFCLDDICMRVQGNYQPDPNGTRLYLGLEHLAQGLPMLVGRGSEADVKSSKNAFLPDDVLFGKLRPYLRKCVLIQEEGVCSTDILVIRANEKVLPQYLCYLCHTDQFVGHAKATTSGVQHPRTSWNSLSEFRLILPPIDEQRRIAHVLSTVQSTIEQQTRIIALTRELKSVLMLKLFTEGLHGEKQKETEIGLVPDSWGVVKVGDVFKFSSGKTRPSDIEENPTTDKSYPVYGGNGIMGYSDKYLLEKPTLILGRVGEYCGVAHHTKGRAWISDNALYTKEIKCEVSTEYMAEYFTFANLNQYSNKAGQPLITQGIISAVSMPLPRLDEQEEIYNHFDLLNKKNVLLRSKKKKLEELFRTLLHQLMTGQIRVNDIDLPGPL